MPTKRKRTDEETTSEDEVDQIEEDNEEEEEEEGSSSSSSSEEDEESPKKSRKPSKSPQNGNDASPKTQALNIQRFNSSATASALQLSKQFQNEAEEENSIENPSVLNETDANEQIQNQPEEVLDSEALCQPPPAKKARISTEREDLFQMLLEEKEKRIQIFEKLTQELLESKKISEQLLKATQEQNELLKAKFEEESQKKQQQLQQQLQTSTNNQQNPQLPPNQLQIVRATPRTPRTPRSPSLMHQTPKIPQNSSNWYKKDPVKHINVCLFHSFVEVGFNNVTNFKDSLKSHHRFNTQIHFKKTFFLKEKTDDFIEEIQKSEWLKDIDVIVVMNQDDDFTFPDFGDFLLRCVMMGKGLVLADYCVEKKCGLTGAIMKELPVKVGVNLNDNMDEMMRDKLSMRKMIKSHFIFKNAGKNFYPNQGVDRAAVSMKPEQHTYFKQEKIDLVATWKNCTDDEIEQTPLIVTKEYTGGDAIPLEFLESFYFKDSTSTIQSLGLDSLIRNSAKNWGRMVILNWVNDPVDDNLQYNLKYFHNSVIWAGKKDPDYSGTQMIREKAETVQTKLWEWTKSNSPETSKKLATATDVLFFFKE